MANGITQDDFFNLVSDQFPRTLQNLEEGATSVMGTPQLTPEEQDQLARLEQRSARLQPIDIQSPQSTRIPGNPYSYDISPVIEGGQNVIENIVNTVRQKRRMGDPEGSQQAKKKLDQAQQRLSELQEQRQTGIQETNLDQKLQQAKRDVERFGQQFQQAQGVEPRREQLLEKKERATESQRNIDDIIASLSPRVFDQFSQMEQRGWEQEQEQQQDEVDHEQSLEEIEARHEARMEQIRERAEQQSGSGSGGQLNASLLNALSDNVEQANELTRSEVGNLQNERAMLSRAIDEGGERLERVKKRLPEETTPQDRIEQLDSEIQQKENRLKRSVEQMITVAARRNQLDPATTARLMGYDPEEFNLGGTGGGEGNNKNGGQSGGDGGGNKTVSQSGLEEYAENTFGGDIEKARSFLESQGYTIGGN